MALAQGDGQVLNHVRAQYLSLVDDEQSRRIIRAHPQTEQQSQFQQVGEIEAWIPKLESPPIPINVLEDSELVSRLTAVKELQQNQETIEEGEEDGDAEDPLHEDRHELQLDLGESLLTSTRNSVATLKIGSGHDVVAPLPQRRSSAQHLVPKYVPSFTRLFRQGSSSSTLEKKKRRSVMTSSEKQGNPHVSDYDEDDDDEDDFDDDYGDFDEESRLNQSQIPESLLDGNDGSKIDLDDELDSSDVVHHESGILVDQNYSDVNADSQVDHFDDSKYLYGENTASSLDDDLLLDSDFSEDESPQILNSTFQSLQFPNSSRSSSRPFTPVKNTNRKLSFDRGVRPNQRLRRSESLVPKGSESLATESTDGLRHAKTSSNLEELLSIQAKSLFEKVDVKPKDSDSKLSKMFNTTKNVSNEDPLKYFLFVSGENISNKFDVLDLTVVLPNGEKLNLKVRKSVTVFETIGFILYNLSRDNSVLLNDPKLRNPNRWCVKLIDEDGEPYEGSFGLLERTKTIASYGEDEIALLSVTESEFNQNELITPNPQLEKSPSTPSPSKPVPLPQNTYYKSIIPPPIDNSTKDSKMVHIRVFDYPATSTSHCITSEYAVTAKLNEVLTKYCKLKMKDTTDYVLKVKAEDFTLDLNDSISSLDGSYDLEVLTKKTARDLKLRKKKLFDNLLPTINSNLTPQTLVLQSNLPDEEKSEQVQSQLQRSSSSRHSSITKHTLASTFRHKNSFKGSVKNNADTIFPTSVTTEYQKFTVWRRLPMSFINRHERTFAIDGEYVYIMPKDEKMWFDTNFKTSTFHVSQIISCKVSKRVPSNFKILVMKTRGPKRYDFEAQTPAEAITIVRKLQSLMNAYKINLQSVS